jgi:type I restriction enzyme, S subunit
MSESVPEGWLKSEISNFVNIGRGYAFKSLDYRSEGNPIVRVTNISEGNGLDLSNDVVYLAKDRVTEFQSYQLKDDDFLLVMVGATVGKYAKVETKRLQLFLNQNMWRLSVIDKKTNWQKFAIYGLQKVVEEFLRTMQGSAREFLTQKEFSKASIFVPPLPEQKKIASILTSVDEVIEKTQSQIDKLQDLKKATMNELLTKGIGHTEFKDSALGRIPKSWECLSVNEMLEKNILIVVKDGNHGSQYPRNSEFQAYGIPFLAASSIDENGLFNVNELPYLSLDRASKLRIPNAISGDVILTHNATVGRVSIIPDHIKEVITSTSTTYYRVNPNKFYNKYLRNFFEGLPFQNQLRRIMGQTTRNQVPISAQKELLILYPISINEQTEISSALSSLLKKVSKTQYKLNKIKSLKKSLMQDLLTGKVRVTVH